MGPFVLLVVLLLVAGWLAAKHPGVRAAIFAALAVRLGLLAIHHWVFKLIPGRGDVYRFYNTAISMSQGGFWEAVSYFSISHSEGYSAIIAAAMTIFGTSWFVPELLNIILGVCCVYTTFRLALNCGASVRDARLAAMVVAIAPSIAQYSVVTLREMVVVLPFMLGLIALTSFRQHQSAIGIALFSFWCVIASFFHGAIITAIAGLGAGLFVFQMFSRRQPGQPKPSVARNVLIMVVFLVAVFGISLGLGDSLNKINSVSASTLVESINTATSRAARGGAGYLEDYSVDGYADIATSAPLRLVYFFFSPLPWQVRKPSHLLGLADVIVYLGCFYLLYRGFRANVLTPKMMVVAGVIATAALAYAFGTSNAGTAIRHRAKFGYALVAIAFAANSQRKQRVAVMARRGRRLVIPPRQLSDPKP